MAFENRHIIGKQMLHLNVISDENHFDLQERFSRFFWEQVQPVLESVFDKYAAGDAVIQLEKLEVDLGEISFENLETEFVKKLTEQLEQSLSKQISGGGGTASKQSETQSRFEQWFHFLETGTLPWNVSKLDNETLKSVLDNLGTSWIATRRLRDLLTGNQRAFKRAIYQFEDDFLATIAELFTGKKQKKLLVFLKAFQKEIQILKTRNEVLKSEIEPSNRVREMFWTVILKETVVQKEKKESEVLTKNFANDFLNKKGEKTIWEILKETLAVKDNLKEISKAVSGYFIEKKGTEFLENLKKEIEKEQSLLIAEADKEKPQKPNEETEFKRDPKSEASDLISEKESRQPNPEPEASVEKEDRLSTEIPAAETDPEKIDSNEQKEPVAAQKSNNEDVINLPDELGIQNAESERETQIKPDANSFKEIENGSGWYIQNAGIVLIHVFMKNLFGKLELIENQEFKDESARHRAIHLVQFLATGQEALPEYEMLLPKFLCGLPFDIPIERNIELTTEEKAECENLLKAAVKHWGALGNASPEALREGFLSREGKLEKRNNGWYLTVEKKTLDILLGRLPWGIGMIKLPWMPDLLRVNWNS